MATAQFIHDGDTIDYTPGANVAAGDVVKLGDLIGIAKRDIPANTLGALAVTGVFDMPKLANAGVSIAAGAKVYWADSPKVVMPDSGAGPYLGKALRAAGDADAAVRVRLEQ